jgi:uncharacterized protein (TIGR02147 family)
MIFEHSNHRSYLRDVLSERIRKNPAYSLRAMARQLGLVCSQLSEVMSGKGGLSLASAIRVARKLELSEEETEYFCWLVQLEGETDPGVRETLVQKVNRLRSARNARPLQDLSVDQFRQIADWYHSAIIELAGLPGFEFAPAAIAAMLGITRLEAEVALERLERLELLYRDERGRWRRSEEDIQVRSPVRNAAMRMFYRQMMDKASAALETQTPDERLSGYETLTFSPEALPEARAAIDGFFEEMLRLSRKYPRNNHVYHLLVHFFDLTQGLSREEPREEQR